jgi:group I intron endonuclease
MNIETADQVKGHIYVITNKNNGKKYVGQTVSHRLNRGKYKLFGYEGRFRDHLSEALCNTKKKQCSYLNNAIRKDGKDSFTCSLILECTKDELDDKEKQYIQEYNSMYPNGYNLTAGGKGAIYIKTSETVNINTLNVAGKRGGCKERTDETREKISAALKVTFNKQEMKEELMKRTQEQHMQQKITRFKNSIIDINNLNQYIRIKSAKGNKYVVVKVGDTRTSFVGKMESIETLKERAIEFLRQVCSAT